MIADGVVWVMVHGQWLAAASLAFLAGTYTAPPWMRRRIRTLGRANKALRDDNRRLLTALAEADAATKGARLVAALERANAEAGFRLAAQAQRRMEAVMDGVACAEMELHWEEER